MPYSGFLVRVASAAHESFAAAARRDGRELAPLMPNVARRGAARGRPAAAPPDVWLHDPGSAGDDADAWNALHEQLDALRAGGAITYAEPDYTQQLAVAPEDPRAFGVRGHLGEYDPQDPDFPRGPSFAWHLGEDFAQLAAAREVAAGGLGARVMHIDTGYTPAHRSTPRRMLGELARDFVTGRPGAADPGEEGFLGVRGHGTGTLGILAGGRVSPDGAGGFDGDLGVAPDAEIVAVRVAATVVLFRTSALARALDYALESRGAEDPRPLVDVVSLSMGGLASQAWAEAVNAAYDAGVVLVAAAGNNFSAGPFGFPTRHIVYPARFRRVIAACGVMADRRPYFGLPLGKMQGCWGPDSKMKTALAAFTPNIAWPDLGGAEVVDMNGQGTSSATPQIAGAAALYVARHREALARYAHGWQRVEAVRHALFASADKSADGGSASRLGNGILQARAALGVEPPAMLTPTPRDSAALAILKVFTGLTAAPRPAAVERMLAVEAAQLVQRPAIAGVPNPFEELVDDPDVAASQLPAPQLAGFIETLRAHRHASRPLRERLTEALDALRAPLVAVAPTPPPRPQPRPRPRAAASSFPRPPQRRLNGYAFDPAIALQLGTRDIGVMTFRLPWEPLLPGPVGEYLEVIDRDAPSDCFYEPVDLDDPHLLARDGLAPSERTPQFHQQMVYAVARLTIANFEAALGRKALWAPGPPPRGASPENDSHYVQRLRIYPHALRDANAFYSPQRKALLFGYFRASDDDPGEHLPGALVFTCLSHDIVAHETAHALLDGMHRKFIAPSNPDVFAFHEAFADIVALLQHFTFPEIVRDQIARTRGSLRFQEHLLGVLATEFGRARGGRGALRDYIGAVDPATGEWRPHVPDPDAYQHTDEPHARGGILVAAVFDAFLAIYERRTEDLVRLATGGSGVLPPGRLPPDLVTRLAAEAAKTAEHVLRMCIRALDYCPPVDITFGDYLRALITADLDLVPDDDLGYRLAFIEAFRRRAIYPLDVRSLSEESLVWRLADVDEYRPSRRLLDVFASLRDAARRHLDETRRERLFHEARRLRRELHDRLAAVLAGPTGAADAACLGLLLRDPPRFQVHAARFANRVGPNGQLITQCIVELVQGEPLDPADPGGEEFEGCSTVVVELGADGPNGVAVRYVVRKRLGSERRSARQRRYRSERGQESLRSTYFGLCTHSAEPFAFLHRG